MPCRWSLQPVAAAQERLTTVAGKQGLGGSLCHWSCCRRLCRLCRRWVGSRGHACVCLRFVVSALSRPCMLTALLGVCHWCYGSHGGGGGGNDLLDATSERGVGAPGSSPTTTPRDATGQASLNHNVYSDARDTVGFPPYHTDLDTGYAPGVSVYRTVVCKCARAPVCSASHGVWCSADCRARSPT